MRVGSLFSGIGGLDLGLERAGMTVAWQSEIDPYACRVLAKHWPTTPNLGDVTTIDWRTVEPVDLICGGYPCPPFSQAGRRQGEDDERYLWPYVCDAIRVLRPRYALLENVTGHLSLGFGRVLGDLAEIGYDVEWDCVPAAAVGAPHRRDRVFIVAHNGRRLRGVGDDTGDGRAVPPQGFQRQLHRSGGREDVADTGGPRLEGRWSRRPTRDRHTWAAEPDVGRVADGVPHRVDRLRALGNAVVPQVAEHIGRRLMEAA